jgi:glycine/D-amino acid oxidase-like deaminating enzyme
MIDLPHDLASEDYSGKAASSGKREIALNRLAITFGADVVSEYELPAEAYDPSGKINAAATAAGDQLNREYAKHLDSMNEPYEMLDAKAMKQRTGSSFYLSGLYTPGTVMLQPALYVRGLAAGVATRIGIFENSPATALVREGRGWRVVSPKGTISAPKVILAVNGHVESFGFFKRKLMHIFTCASMTRALTVDEVKVLRGSSRWSVTPADPMGSTVRRISGTGGDRIVIRSRFTYDPSMEVQEYWLSSAALTHDASFQRRFPMLPNVAMEHCWAGHLCLSRNSVPAFGEVAEGIVSACCQNGLGTTKGTLAGMAAAEKVLGQPGEALRGVLAYDAPKHLPPEPFAWLGINGYLRYKEWKAGAEL